METDKEKLLEKYGVKSPEEREKDLLKEKKLWNDLLEKPDVEKYHNDYFAHIVRSGLLKEASRRYGTMVDDKDNYSIETRRLARMFRKQIVNLMFMTPVGAMGKEKNPTLGYVFIFIAVMMIFTGLLALKFWYVALAGLFYLVPYIIIKVSQARKKAAGKFAGDKSITGQF